MSHSHDAVQVLHRGAGRHSFPLSCLWQTVVSIPGESAGNFGENGSLSPVARWGTGSTGLSRGTWHFHLRGKCREFPRKRFTFPRGRMGYRLHRPLSRHLAFPPPGKVPGISAKTVHFPLVVSSVTCPTRTLLSLTNCHL